jgi:hypothetical protein
LIGTSYNTPEPRVSDQPLSRRRFVASSVVAGLGVLVGAYPVRAVRCCAHPVGSFDPGPNPTPRPGIDASRVLKPEQLGDSPSAIPAFNEVRQIPQIVDGIRCHCGCATLKGFYSLLSCYEGDAMARDCHVCQGQGRMAFRLHGAGKSLDEIREAIEAKYA